MRWLWDLNPYHSVRQTDILPIKLSHTKIIINYINKQIIS